MAGTKRTHDIMDGNHNANTGTSASTSASTTTVIAPEPVSRYMPMFEHFRAELDEHHDRRERVIKASKDITANSKKIIFALQRVKTLNKPISDKRVASDTARLQKSITDLFTAIGPDLTSLNAHRYHRNISGGIQEYMEAVLFQHYIEHQRLMTHAEAQAAVPGGVDLTYEDYLLGLFDTTGEMMRFAITNLGRERDGETSPILVDLQAVRAELEMVDVQRSWIAKDFEAKLKVTRQSVEKVENGVYGMIVRGKERPPGWMPDMNERREEQETY